MAPPTPSSRDRASLPGRPALTLSEKEVLWNRAIGSARSRAFLRDRLESLIAANPPSCNETCRNIWSFSPAPIIEGMCSSTCRASRDHSHAPIVNATCSASCRASPAYSISDRTSAVFRSEDESSPSVPSTGTMSTTATSMSRFESAHKAAAQTTGTEMAAMSTTQFDSYYKPVAHTTMPMTMPMTTSTNTTMATTSTTLSNTYKPSVATTKTVSNTYTPSAEEKAAMRALVPTTAQMAAIRKAMAEIDMRKYLTASFPSPNPPKLEVTAGQNPNRSCFGSTNDNEDLTSANESVKDKDYETTKQEFKVEAMDFQNMLTARLEALLQNREKNAASKRM